MIRALIWLAAVIALLTAAWLTYRYFFGDTTRLTEVPPLIPNNTRSSILRSVRPAHVIVIVEENKSNGTIIGNAKAPYLNQLARASALFVNATGVAHPSQPNYLALFAGQTNSDADSCPEKTVPSSAPSLGGALMRSRLTFSGYAEALPRTGFTGCSGGDRNDEYARKHAPWVNFADVPPSSNIPLSSLPSLDKLPTVCFIIPDLENDMHSGSIEKADAWLRRHVEPIVTWANAHNSLVIVAWDESDTTYGNSVPLIIAGARVKPGTYSERVDHYRVLRTIEELYGLPYLGYSANVAPIDDIWKVVQARTRRAS
ncbi:MAG TPA: alkaline phosphatase family protein [Candidatus Eremiobacteraceae bacterium]|nr:alkaline phosphatase family protein [Candidatus Eremiobacteraceae bacterium]